MTVRIRPAVAADVGRINDIERAAGAMFADVGMPEVADDEPMAPDTILASIARGDAWVVELGVDGDEAVVAGYLVADTIDGDLYVHEVSVDPVCAGRGLGAQLLDHVVEVAGSRGCPRVVLSTFVEVPWNAPYYRRLGFADGDVATAGPELTAQLATETAAGLDPAIRVVMARPTS